MAERINRKSGGSKKIGRSLIKCTRYRAEGRREKNKRRRMEKLEKKYTKNRERRTA